MATDERRARLETFPNPHPQRAYRIEHVQPEYTSVCPVTGQPDYGQITVRYIADTLCVELKSLKLYFQSFRNEGVFYEDAVNQILDDLVAVVKPREMVVTGTFTPRGGMYSTITAEYRAPRRRK
ncbi:MAG: preQ(1) synthase [Planctomycetota bacterium]